MSKEDQTSMKKDLEKNQIDQPSPEKSNAKFKRIIFLESKKCHRND